MVVAVTEVLRGELNGARVTFDGVRVECPEPLLRLVLEQAARAALARGEDVRGAWRAAFGQALVLEEQEARSA